MSTIRLPDCTFYEWMMDLNRTYPGLIVPTPPRETTNWWRDAMLLISANKDTLNTICLPLKSQFSTPESWRKWAYFFIQNTSH